MVERTPIAVAYTYRRKNYVKVFTDLRCPDPIISNRSTKLPAKSVILEIGVGSKFENKFKLKYIK